MILAEFRRYSKPLFYEFSEPLVIRLGVATAYRKGLPCPVTTAECLSVWGQACDELLTFDTWTAAEQWVSTTERPDRESIRAALECDKRLTRTVTVLGRLVA